MFFFKGFSSLNLKQHALRPSAIFENAKIILKIPIFSDSGRMNISISPLVTHYSFRVHSWSRISFLQSWVFLLAHVVELHTMLWI